MMVAHATETKDRSISAATFYQLSGLALLIALPPRIVGWLMHPPAQRLAELLSPLQQASHVITFVSWIFAGGGEGASARGRGSARRAAAGRVTCSVMPARRAWRVVGG